jgi:uncharacterized membrane protein
MKRKYIIAVIMLLVLISLIPSNLIYAEAGKLIPDGNSGSLLNEWVNSGIKNIILKGNKYYDFVGKYPDYNHYSKKFILSYKEVDFSLEFDPEKFGIEWGGLNEIKWANGGILENLEQYQGTIPERKDYNNFIPKTFREPIPDKINIKGGTFNNQFKDGSLKVDFIPFGITDQDESEYEEIPLGISVQDEREHMSL